MRIKLSEKELWVLIDCLGWRGNTLNQQFLGIHNYFRRNSEASEEYAAKCVEVTSELIDIAQAQIKLLKKLQLNEFVKQSIQGAEKNLATYQKAYNSLANADVRIEVVSRNYD